MGWLAESGVIERWRALSVCDEILAHRFAYAAIATSSIFDQLNGMQLAKRDVQDNATTLLRVAASNESLQRMVGRECDGKSQKEIRDISKNGKTGTCALM